MGETTSTHDAERPPPAIFISYRRRDAIGYARALHEYLSRRFGPDQVFFDLHTIESGTEFPKRLRRGVEECRVLLALIGDGWLSERLHEPGDLVRLEIALALERQKQLIPILLDNAPVPPAEKLPDVLCRILAIDMLQLRGKTYEYWTQRDELVRLIAKTPGLPDPLPDRGDPLGSGLDAKLPEVIAAATAPLQALTDDRRARTAARRQ